MTPVGEPPPGWARIGDDMQGIPLWQRHGEGFYVATRDMDQLRFVGAALAQFDRMSGREFCEYVAMAAPCPD